MRLEKHLLTILRLGVFLVFLTPLIYTGSTIFPFIFGKTLYFRGLIEILFALYLILIIAFPKYRPKNSLLFNAILIYAFVMFLAMIFGVDASRSFWSNHERMMGYFTFLHAFAFFIIAAAVFKDRDDWRGVFIATTVVSFILNFLGIYQYLQNGTFLHTAGGGKVYSTLGNYIYLGGYSLWHIFIAFAFLLRQKVSWPERGFWIFSVVLNGVGLVLAGSRGPFLGAFAGILLALIAYIIFSKLRKVKIVFGALLLVIVAASVFIWLNKDSDFVKSRPILARFTDISFMTATGSTRLLNWGVAWESFKDRPILGWGPDNYYIAFNKHYNPKFYEFGQYETWQDHAHNVIFDTLNEGGILGLLSYLFIFLALGLTLLKAFKNKTNEDVSLIIFPAVAVAAYFIQNLFVFDTLTLLMLFYICLSFIHSSYGSPEGGELKIVSEIQRAPTPISSKLVWGRASALASETSKFWQKTDPIYKTTILTGTVLLSLVFIYIVDIGPFRASRLTIKALQSYQSDFYGSYNLFKKALSIRSPYLKETRDEFSKMIFALANAQTGLTKDELRTYFAEATRELEKVKEEHPKDVFVHMYLTQWYFTMGGIFGEEEFFRKAEEEAAIAQTLSPKRQQVLYTLARLYMLSGNYPLAEQILQKTAELNPKVGDTYWHLGLVYLKTGQNEFAFNNFVKSIRLVSSIYPAPIDFKNSFAVVKEMATSSDILDWYLGQSGGKNFSATDYLNLARAYKRVGDYEGMRRAIAAATSTDPAIELYEFK